MLLGYALAALMLACPPDHPVDSAHEGIAGMDAGAALPQPANEQGGDYEWIARRGGVTLAVAESRGVDRERVAAVGMNLLVAFERCASERRSPPSGAMRVVLGLDPSGHVTGFNLTAADAARVLTLVCFVAPAKTLSFGAVENTVRAPGVAFEAVWNVEDAGH